MASRAKTSHGVALLFGDDDMAVRKRAEALFDDWGRDQGKGEIEKEIVDGRAGNSQEVLQCVGRLNEAIQTLPFFGTGKVVWFKGCTFLGDDRVSRSQAAGEALEKLTELILGVAPEVRVIITSPKVDRRKSFYRKVSKKVLVEGFESWSPDDRDWMDKAETWVRGELAERGKSLGSEAMNRLLASVGPNRGQLSNEVEKLSLAVGDSESVDVETVASLVSSNRFARAFAVGEALGDRDLKRTLESLEDEFWEMRIDRQRNPIGLLYGLISKVRVLIMAKEMIRLGWIRRESSFPRFRGQVGRIPSEGFSSDRRFNPAAINPFVLFKATSQVENYRMDELLSALEALLECNRQLIFSSLGADLVLQQTLVSIIGGSPSGRASSRSGRRR